MNILEEIRKTVAIFDPELVKNEADDVDTEQEDKPDVNIDSYQNAVDSAVDPEDLNFSMDSLFGDDEEDDGEDVEHFAIPQKDHEEEPLKVGDSVQKIARTSITGKVLAVGELIQVEWDPELTTLEYPEELIHAEENDEEEQEKVKSLETDPPIPIEDPNS